MKKSEEQDVGWDLRCSEGGQSGHQLVNYTAESPKVRTKGGEKNINAPLLINEVRLGEPAKPLLHLLLDSH